MLHQGDTTHAQNKQIDFQPNFHTAFSTVRRVSHGPTHVTWQNDWSPNMSRKYAFIYGQET